MSKTFAYLCLAMCVLYGLLLIVAVPLVGVLLAISGFGYGDKSAREVGEVGAMIAYAALLVAGLPACIGLLRRYLSGGPAALRDASRWSWICAAGTLLATVLLLVVSLVALYAPGAGQSPGFESFALSAALYPLGIVFPYLRSLRRSDRKAA